VLAEYAKAGPDDVLIRVTVTNRAPADGAGGAGATAGAALIHILPTLWFRNSWSWGCTHEGCERKPGMWADLLERIVTDHATLGQFYLHIDTPPAEILFTENETNRERLFGAASVAPQVKDAFHRYLVNGEKTAVNRKRTGTKAAAHYRVPLKAGESVTLRLRLNQRAGGGTEAFGDFDAVFATRIAEADAFHAHRLGHLAEEERAIARQAYGGLLWSKQFYHYAVREWLAGDPDQPPPPAERRNGRNHDWGHLFNRDVLCMPDKWEYPWYASWDLAFHTIALAKLDGALAKEQLILLLREWYMHPSGKIPAYEFAFSDANPPVHAWACWRVYKMTGPRGKRDLAFLARTFQKLLINFTWWINRKDVEGKHIFAGGFLGLDNIGVIDRSQPLPSGQSLEQADGTAWMAFYCATMLSMALELAYHDAAYEDVASKFFEHFVAIVDAINSLDGSGLWDETDGFYYDHLRSHGASGPVRIRSAVGLIPMLAVEVLEHPAISKLPGFMKRMEWFLKHRSDLARNISYMQLKADSPECGHYLLAVPSQQRLVRLLGYMLDEKEFLSPFGVRSMSQVYARQPFVLKVDGKELRVSYEPGESETGMFGGNSNWRGPVWFPLNFLLIEALERYHHFYGEDLKVECPTGSGKWMTLREVSRELRRRLAAIFLPDASGRRPCFGEDARFAADPHWKGLLLFHEYFHAETGRGLGASHQTGWTALIARCMEELADNGNASAGHDGW